MVFIEFEFIGLFFILFIIDKNENKIICILNLYKNWNYKMYGNMY